MLLCSLAEYIMDLSYMTVASILQLNEFEIVFSVLSTKALAILTDDIGFQQLFA